MIVPGEEDRPVGSPVARGGPLAGAAAGPGAGGPGSTGEAGGPPRTGYVTLVGRPNAGKSTLMNAFVGEKLSIVTAKAQTTWRRVTGIHTGGGVQMIFLDTPGLLEPRDLLQRSMLGAALEALTEADVVLLVLDATRPLDPAARDTLDATLSGSKAPLVVALNKTDVADPAALRELTDWAAGALKAPVHPVSALTGDGVEELRTALRERLPPGPFLYPEDHIASDPVRFFVAELVRETVFEQFHEEIPWSVMCEVGEFREDSDPLYIQVDLLVERASQKGILIGKGGRAISGLGRSAREKIEHFLGRPVYLDLWVKPLAGWRRKRAHLARLGFHAPEEP